MLSVSDRFHAKEQSDVNRPCANVFLVLGNYAASGMGASAAASGAAANYPAAGAIDGDRTELNIGAASAADNDVGQSSWQSTVAPDTTPQTLTINFGQSRTFNRIKLYHMIDHGLDSYKISYSTNGVDFTDFAGTPPYHTGSNQFTSTGTLDTIDLAANITATHIKLTVNSTVVAADMANVIELEVYRLVEITDRVISVKTASSRDYQLVNPLAATATIECDNTDKFFSPSYSPSSDETTDGFVNSELRPAIGLIVKYGFGDPVGSEEVVQNFIGTLDRISVKPGSRRATLEARDGMKGLFNKTVSTKLKTNQDIGSLVTYMLNKANISTHEIDADEATITLDYFFTYAESIATTIRDLVEASGDAVFYFDEDGLAVYRMYLNSVPQEELFSTEAEFEAGTLTNIDTNSTPGSFRRKWFKLDDFEDGNFTSNPAWTVYTGNIGFTGGPANQWSVSSGQFRFTGSSSLHQGRSYIPFSGSTGTWEFKATIDADLGAAVFYFMGQSIFTDFGVTGQIQEGYALRIARAGALTNLSLVKVDSSGGETVLDTSTHATPSAQHTYRITRDSAGLTKVYVDGSGTASMEATDTDYTTSAYLGLKVIPASVGQLDSFDDFYFSNELDPTGALSTAQAIIESSVVDMTVDLLELGIFEATTVVPSGTTLQFQTATSDNGVTFDAWVDATPGSVIASTLRRYIKWRAVLTTPQDAGTYGGIDTPSCTDVTINWFTGAGSTKFPSNVSFVFDENLNFNIEQNYADTVGGQGIIVNDASVQASPLILDGSDTDDQWIGTTGTPPAEISASNPLAVTNTQVLTYEIVVPGGMDTSRMSGANPAAVAITFAGGGAGSWVFSSIHPTKPVLVITITGTGTITNLRVQGKVFTQDATHLAQRDEDTASQQLYDIHFKEVSNPWIVNTGIALDIAERLVLNFASPTTYIPSIKVRPTFSIQIGDRVTVEDENIGISEDSIVIGVEHNLSISEDGGEAFTNLTLLKVA